MHGKISKRLLDIVDALPLKSRMCVLEIGCGPGAMAREMANRIDNGFVLGIDRSATAIRQAVRGSKKEIESGRLMFLQVAVEDLEPKMVDCRFDLVVAVRVGAFDGRHPEVGEIALRRIEKVIKRGGRFFIDGGAPIKEIRLPNRK